MIAFYIFGIVELQGMLPLIMEAKKKYNCWVCFFDSFTAKRQLYHYTDEEIFSLMPEINCDIYRSNDKNKFAKDYSIKKPQYIFIQTISPQYPTWLPSTDQSKVIHLAYYIESKHLKNSFTNINLTIVNDEKYLNSYRKHKNVRYFGNYRLDNVNFVKEKEHPKRCFMVESWLRGGYLKNSILHPLVDFYNNLFTFLRKNNYEIVWKRREKGFPKEGWASPLDYCSIKPDVIIDKDLMAPSSIFHYSTNSDLCLFVDDCFAFFDSVEINSNCFILKSPLYPKREYKFNEGWFNKYLNRVLSYNNFKKLDIKPKIIQQHSCTSKEIINYIKN